MSRLIETYLQYGVPSDAAKRFESYKLSVSTFRATSIQKLFEHYGISSEEASQVKRCINRKPIQQEVIQKLLESSNFVCCCCKGIKGDSYIIHHITEYEVSQDNNYDNLAVLCPNDHDLAHRSPGLTNKLTPAQIRRSKASWEQQVRSHNLDKSQSHKTIIQSTLASAIEKATVLGLNMLSTPFHRPFQYIGMSVADAAKAVGRKPNEVGNIIIDTDQVHMLLQAEGNFISYVDLELKKTAPWSPRRPFDSEPILGALSINPSELVLVRKQTHFHTYYDHKRRLKVGVSCQDEDAPLSIGFSSKYYGM